MSIEIHGNNWKPMETNGKQRKRNGNQWKQIPSNGHRGDGFDSMATCEHHWKYMEII